MEELKLRAWLTEYLDYPVAGIDVYNDGSVIINLGDKND